MAVTSELSSLSLSLREKAKRSEILAILKVRMLVVLDRPPCGGRVQMLALLTSLAVCPWPWVASPPGASVLKVLEDLRIED